MNATTEGKSMTLALFYIGIAASGYALYYGGLDAVLIASLFFAQATTLLLVSTRPKADTPRVAAVGGFAMFLYLALALTPLDYSVVPVLPLLLASVGAFVMNRVMTPKPVFS